MKKFAPIAAAVIGLAFASAAFAQTPAPAKPAAPAAMPAAKPAAMSASDKAALSKKCSADADAKGLHGKERKKFRSACKEGK